MITSQYCDVVISTLLERKILAFETRACRRRMHIRYTARVTNSEVRSRNEGWIEESDNLLKIVRRWKLDWFGLVNRKADVFVKYVIQGSGEWTGKRHMRHMITAIATSHRGPGEEIDRGWTSNVRQI